MISILFYNTLLTGLIIAVFILFVYLISPILSNKYQIFWRFNIWKTFTFFLIVPIGFLFRFFKNNEMGRESVKYIQTVPSGVQTEANPMLIVQSISENCQTSAWTNLLDVGPHWIPIIWFVGVCIFAVYFIGVYTFFRYNTKERSRIIYSNIIEEIQMDFFKEHKKKRQSLPVYCSNAISSPMIVGILKPVVIIPQREYSQNSLKIILTHELTHYIRKDLLYKGVALIALIMHWYNPAIYMMMKTMDKDMEICCDQDVIKGKAHAFRVDYGDVIMNEIVSSAQRRGLIACFGCDKATITERFKNIFSQKKHKGKPCFILALLFVLLVSNFAYGSDKDFSYFVDNPEYNQLLDSVVAEKQEAMKAKLEEPRNEQEYEYFPNYLELCAKYANEDGVIDQEGIAAVYKEAGLPPPKHTNFNPKSVETSYSMVKNSIEPHVMANGERALYCNESGSPWKLKKGDIVKLHVFSDAERFGSKGCIIFGYYKDGEYTQMGEIYSKGEDFLTIDISESGKYNFYLFNASLEPIVIKWINVDI